MDNEGIRKTAREIVEMLDEIEDCREECSRQYCEKHRMNYGDPADYARAVSEVSDYERPLTSSEKELIERCSAPGDPDLSEYGFSLKKLWKKVRGTANRYRERSRRKVSEGLDWLDEKKEAAKKKASDAKKNAIMAYALLPFLRKLKAINRQYERDHRAFERMKDECLRMEKGSSEYENCKRKAETFLKKANRKAIINYGVAIAGIDRRKVDEKLIGVLKSAMLHSTKRMRVVGSLYNTKYQPIYSKLKKDIQMSYPEYEWVLRHLE